MDVRCDRCHTEYELDDRSVTDSGASVQCTSCGHTFIVSRKGAAPAPSTRSGTPALGVQQADPAPADWLLATQEGETHRFRDLSTLHKWIVERKVTREDRVSQKGGAWRQLGDLLDLAPFFDVVAQADRVRAAEPTTQFQRPTPVAAASAASAATPVARTRSQAGRMTPRAPALPSVTEDDDEDSDLYQSGQFAPPEVPTRVPLVPVIDEEFPPLYPPPTNRGAKIVSGLLVVVGLAALAAYAGFKQPNWLPFFKKPDAPPVEPVASAPAASPPAVAVPAPAAPVAAAAAPRPEATPASPPPTPAAAEHPVAAAASPPPAEVAKTPPAAGRPAAEAPAAPPRAKGYDRLIADADRLLENGQTAKAQKLYEEALTVQPNGVAALTGQAYVLLDREKVMAAIGTFRRALASSPDYPPAIFGLAEAYRAQGDSAQAVEQYKRYLNVAPAGPDAHAARGQIKTLESGAGRRAEPPSPTATIPDSTTPPPR